MPASSRPFTGRPRGWAFGLLFAATVATVSGCADAGAGDPSGALGGSAAATPGGAPSTTTAPPGPGTPPCTPAPLPRRAAATLVVGLPGVVSAAEPLARSVIDLGVSGVFLSESNVQGATQVKALTAGLREQAGRPLLVSTDEESGRVAITRELVGSGPSPRRLAATRTPEEVRAFAAGIGRGLAGLGVDLDLAPVLDLDSGPSRGIIGDRSFSAEPQRAADYGLAFARGLADAGVVPTVKHFPGQGRSTKDTHRETGLVDASVDALRTTDLLPFQEAVDAGAPVVMVNHLAYQALDPDLPASLAPATYALLRSMGFTGVAMTDSVGMGAVNLRFDFPEAAVRAVQAGADAVLATDGNQAARMTDALVAAVTTGRLPESRLDEAAARVTSLAGGDVHALTCLDLRVPRLEPASP